MDILLFLFALLLGVVAAIPIGPCQIETVKRAVAGHLKASLLVVFGSASSDVLYGLVALYGIAPALDLPAVLAAFSAVVVLILWVLAYLTWRHADAPRKLYREPKLLRSGRWAYATGFLFGMSNPPIIASWLFGVALAKRFGVAPTPFSAVAKAIFIAGAVLGAGGYLTVLALVSHRLRRSFSMKAMATVYRCLAVALLLISFYFAYGVVRFVLRSQGAGL